MPKIALADTLLEWDSLYRALGENPALDTPDLRNLRERLRLMLEATQELTAEQDALQARRQAVTQQLRITRGLGDDLVIKIRASLRSVMGHANEGLVRFGIRPTRRRARESTLGTFPRPDLLAAAGIKVPGPQTDPGAPSAES